MYIYLERESLQQFKTIRCFADNHTVDCNHHSFVTLICNFLLLKDNSFNTKCLLV